MTYEEACARAEQFLCDAEISDARLDAWLLLEHVSHCSKALYYANPKQMLTEKQESLYFDLVKKRSTHIPLQHLTGVQQFMGLEFQVNSHVLIPRQDTETLVEEALKLLLPLKSNCRILDMCTGSGCILLSILHHLKSKTRYGVQGIGIDLSEKALTVAQSNSHKLEVPAAFLKSDLFTELKDNDTFQMIVSNPPYIPTEEIETLQTEVKYYDPRVALDGKKDGLFFYEEIIKEAGIHLENNGYLLFEIGAKQGVAVSEMMLQAGYRNIVVKKDLAGLDRVVIGMYDRQSE